MNGTQSQKNELENIAWGAIFIWWGITELIPSLPKGTSALGIGLILLGLNAMRYFSGLPTSLFTITLGILAVVWGALDLAGVFLNLPFEIPVFAVLLIVLGAIVLARAIIGKRNASVGGLQ